MNKYIKGIAVACVAIFLLVMLAGCSSSSDSSKPAVTITETYAPEDDPVTDYFSSDEDAFINAIQNDDTGNSILYYADNVSLLDAGWAVCTAFDAGYTVDEIIVYLVGSMDMTDDEAYAYGYIIGAAATTLCPEYYYLVS